VIALALELMIVVDHGPPPFAVFVLTSNTLSGLANGALTQFATMRHAPWRHPYGIERYSRTEAVRKPRFSRKRDPDERRSHSSRSSSALGIGPPEKEGRALLVSRQREINLDQRLDLLCAGVEDLEPLGVEG
jgi:hypothetical protein